MHIPTWRVVAGPVALAALLAACAAQTDVSSDPTLVPTLSQPTAAVVSPTITVGPPPTDTLAPEAEATAFAQAVLGGTPERVETSIAPDGVAMAELWTAPCTTVPGFEHYGPVGYSEIRWLASTGTAPVVVVRQILVCQGLGAAGLRVLQWSPDSRYVFYTDAAQGSPDGGGCPWFGRVLRWSTADGTTTSLGNGATSPDGQRVVGVDGADVTIWSWGNTEVVRVATLEPAWSVSAIGWAPDGERVLFVQSDNACAIGGSSVIGMVDLAAGTARELLRTRDPALLTFRFESIDEMTFYGTSPDAHRFRLTADALVPLP